MQDGAAYRSREWGTASQRPRLRVSYTTSGSGAFSVTIDFVSTGRPYSTSTAQAGALYYIDRSYTIGSIGSALAGGILVRTANDDKTVTAPAHLTFTASGPANVWVGYDKRAATLPSWLNDGSWTATGDVLAVSDGGASPLRVFRKSVAAGQVTLGGNHAGGNTGAGSHYVVVVKSSTSAAASLAALPPDVWEHPGDSDGDGLADTFEATVFTDPQDPDTDGDGEPDESELDATGRTLWEAQETGGSAAAGGGGGESGCGATGLEALLAALLARAILRR